MHKALQGVYALHKHCTPDWAEISGTLVQDSPGLMSLPFWQWLIVVEVIVLHAAILHLLPLLSFFSLHRDWLHFYSAGDRTLRCGHDALTGQGNCFPGAWCELCCQIYRPISDIHQSAESERAGVEAAARTLGPGANLTIGLLSSFTGAGAIWVHPLLSLSCRGGCASACSEAAGSACCSPAPSLCMPCVAFMPDSSGKTLPSHGAQTKPMWSQLNSSNSIRTGRPGCNMILCRCKCQTRNINGTRQGDSVLQQCASADACTDLRLWLCSLQRLLSLIRLQQWSLNGGSARDGG